MALQLRDGIVEHKPAARLEGIVECDEVYAEATSAFDISKTP